MSPTASAALVATIAGVFLLTLLPALAGLGLGQWMRLRVQPVLFKKLFLGSLLVVGAYRSVRAWMQP